MDFGIAIATAADAWTLVERAEALGFTQAWFYDTQMLSADCFVAMGAAALKTRRIRLGTGVLIPSNRIAPVAANAFATLNRLAPGRIDFGVGTGFTGRQAMGLGAIKLADQECGRSVGDGVHPRLCPGGGRALRFPTRHGTSRTTGGGDSPPRCR
jgi:5,10-methylenetetrahydromethanopterin reductase